MTEKRPRGRPRKAGTVLATMGPQWTPQHEAPPALPPAVSDTEALVNAIVKASRDPATDISKMDWLLKTSLTIKDDQAREDYNAAMARVQAALEPVRRAALNPQTSSKYATEAALDEAIRPYYTAEGFALEFDTEPIPDRDDKWVMIVCYCSRGRERRRHQIPMPCDGLGPKGTPVMSRTHATGSAYSYGRRYLRCGVFNVITADMARSDDDGNRAGRYQPRDNAVIINPAETGELADKTDTGVLRAVMKRADVHDDIVLSTFGVEKLEDLTKFQTKQAIKKCNKKLDLMYAEEQAEASSREAPNTGPSEPER